VDYADPNSPPPPLDEAPPPRPSPDAPPEKPTVELFSVPFDAEGSPASPPGFVARAVVA
jgi:hypothetical protein